MRIYADMHQSGGVEKFNRYGESFAWGYYFIVSAALMAIYHMKLWVNTKKRHDIAKSTTENMKGLWVRKVFRQKYTSLKDFFIRGSDIPGNFGILIGLKSVNKAIETSPYISMYETRVGSVISTGDWSHVEVPRMYMDIVSKAMNKAKCSIPIYAIEDCEQYWSSQPFSSPVS